MEKERWLQIKDIFNSALQYSGAEQEAYLSDVCASDPELRREVEVLLHSYQSDFMEVPVMSNIAELRNETFNKIQIGEEINHYKILDVLGRGGMGEVYLAEDTKLCRKVAIKFLKYTNEKTERHLKREARTSALLNHPNICTIFEIGESRNGSFIAMEYIEGETLDKLIHSNRLTFNEIIAIVQIVAEALFEAHTNGVIHRDIKPSNVIVTPKGQIKVLDFGLAKRTILNKNDSELSFLSNGGVIAGTVSYMSPEQTRGQEIDARSDLWSLGVVFYEMITKTLPFKGETKADIIAAVLTGKYTLAGSLITGLPPMVDDIIGKALQKDQDQRFLNADSLLNDLQALRVQTDFELPFVNHKIVSTSQSNRRPSSDPSNFVGRSYSYERSTASEKRRITDSADIVSDLERPRPLVSSWMFRVLIVSVLGLAGLAGWRIFQTGTKIPVSFSAASRDHLQISSLFTTKRKPNGSISNISFSPDGKLIAFLLTADRSFDIYVKPVDSGEPVKITDGKNTDKILGWKGTNKSAVWSPSGERLAFIAERDGKFGIWTVSYLGGTPVLQNELKFQNTFVQLKKWSNDGKRIFLEAQNSLKTIEIDSGQIDEIPLPDMFIAGNFSISNDEKLISYVVIENEKETIWFQSLETGKTTRLSSNEFSNWSPVFFPDNQRIAYSSDQSGNFQIFVADISTLQSTQITFGESNANFPTVSPDGTKIIFVSESDEANIFSYNFQTEKEVQQTSKTKLQLFADVSPNEDKLVYQVTDYQANIYTSPIKIKNVNSDEEPYQISDHGGWAKWSPKGDKIAYLKFSGTNVNLWTINVSDRREKQLTSEGVVVENISISPYNQPILPFTWSADGAKIAYASRQTGYCDIWTINEDGSNPENLTANNDKNLKYFSPVWDSLNSRLAFGYRLEIDENKYRYGVSVFAGNQISEIVRDSAPVKVLGWNETGENLIVAVGNNDKTELFTISTLSGNKRELLANLGQINFHSLKLSPDSRNVVFSARRDGVENVFLYQIKNKTLQITKNLENTLFYSGITWSADGHDLFYSKQSGGMQISMVNDSK